MVIEVMIVTEDSDASNFLKKKLNNLDAEYKIIEVDDGMKCLCFLEDNHIPDVILIDVEMDGMDGIDVFNKLKGNSILKNIPLVFLLGRNDGFSEFFICNVLGADCILKPVDVADLKIKIEKVLEIPEINNLETYIG